MNQPCRRVHFLHAADSQVHGWTEIGRYVIHFADGTKSEQIPIRNYIDLLKYDMRLTDPVVLYKPFDFSSPVAVPAWIGHNSETQSKGHVLRLFKRTWEIPNGPKKVASIELTSGQSAKAAPFVVAITVE